MRNVWTAGLSAWLDGEVLTYDSRDYSQNFFCIVQMRPDVGPDSDKRDEDIFSDEESDMESVQLDAFLQTHVGFTREYETDGTIDEAAWAAHQQKKQDAMNKRDACLKPGRRKEQNGTCSPKRR